MKTIKNLNIAALIAMFIASPIIINVIVNNGPWFGIEAANNNDWIGFFGTYFSGIITAIGLGVTILYTTWQYKDHDRKRVQPYLTINQLHKIGPIDQTIGIENADYKIGLIGALSEVRDVDDEYGFHFEKIDLYGELSNIGIGTAINITIHDIKIEKRDFGDIKSPVRSLSVENKTYFRIILNDVFIKSTLLTEEVLKSETLGRSKIPRLQLNFRINYFDMLGNKYFQDVKTEIQVTDYANVLFRDITFPKQV